MKFVNLIVGQKRNLMSNLDSISKCQHKKFENINDSLEVDSKTRFSSTSSSNKASTTSSENSPKENLNSNV